MRTMVRVENGEITEYRLPRVGVLGDGRTVSGYHLLDEDILLQEGWLTLEDIKPDYDENTQYLLEDGYEILENKVIKKYRIEDIPLPEVTEIEATQNFVAMTFRASIPNLEPTEILSCEPLVQEWEQSQYGIGDVRRWEGQVWECCQGHDSRIHTTVIPGQSPAFWFAYHSKDPRYAKPFVQPTGAHDRYKLNEYCRWYNEIYKSINDNNTFPPTGYPAGWELYTP